MSVGQPSLNHDAGSFRRVGDINASVNLKRENPAQKRQPITRRLAVVTGMSRG